jgi:hypothetical protein
MIVQDRGRDFLETVLTELVTDPAFRATLVAGGGFCERHTRQAVTVNRGRVGGATASATLFGSVVRERARRLGRDEATRRARDCPVCAEESKAAATAVARYVEHASVEARWREGVFAAQWCLSHLGNIASAARRRDRTLDRELLAAQSDRLSRLADLLDRLVHHSAHDRRHLLTEEEQRSVDDAARLLAGEALG